MKRKIPILILSCLLACSIGFGVFSAVRWKQAEQEIVKRNSMILSENYDFLRQIKNLPVLLQEDGNISLNTVARYMNAFTNAQNNCSSLISPAVAEKEGWNFLIASFYSPGNLMGAGNTVVNALSCLSFDGGSVCKPEGDLLILIQAVDEWKKMFDSAFESAYPSGWSDIQNADMYIYYKEAFVPAIEQKLFQSEDSIKVLEKIDDFYQSIRK